MRAIARDAVQKIPPVLAGALLVMWLLLNDTLSLGSVVLGAVLAAGIAWASGTLRPLTPRIRNARLIPPLLASVLYDIVRSNIGVARIVLGLVRSREVSSGFVRIPLELTDPHGLAVLAGIVTATPGTVWVDYDVEASALTLHVLDLTSEQEWIAWIKSRYESPLLRIFQ